ncbi:MAG: response regulator transcription factor [Nannocystaceae bacterium]|nr:response regulator transcription factor [Nannocystaceae bacterium]
MPNARIAGGIPLTGSRPASALHFGHATCASPSSRSNSVWHWLQRTSTGVQVAVTTPQCQAWPELARRRAAPHLEDFALRKSRVDAPVTASGASGGTLRVVKILLIEDDARLAERTAEYLRSHDAAVEIVGDGTSGLARALAGEHDIVLLDLMLPGMDGLQVCKSLRQKKSTVPVIMLTARGEEIDRVVGLELGADDYLSKPFSPRELLARIRAVLRRHNTTETPAALLEEGPLVIDRDRRVATVRDNAMELTAYQFDLLWAMAEGAGKVLSREQLHNRVRELRGEAPAEFDPAVDRSIDVHMSKVRGAIAAADDTAKGLIRTVRGVGYVLGGEDS